MNDHPQMLSERVLANFGSFVRAYNNRPKGAFDSMPRHLSRHGIPLSALKKGGALDSIEDTGSAERELANQKMGEALTKLQAFLQDRLSPEDISSAGPLIEALMAACSAAPDGMAADARYSRRSPQCDAC